MADAFLAKSGEDIVGGVFGYCNDDAGKTSFISYIAHRQNAEKGLGTRLHEHFERLAARRGMLRIRLEVRKRNLHALAFYQRIGYSVVNDSDPVLTMEKRLPGSRSPLSPQPQTPAMDFFTQNSSRLRLFTNISQSVGARPDYVQGGGGNTSVKFPDGQMAIKASGFCLKDITPSDAYAVLDGAALRKFYLDSDPASFDDIEKAGSEMARSCILAIDGLAPRRPSVEAGFHSILDTFVAHSHAVYANLAACAADCEDIVRSALSDAGYAYGVVPYVDPGAKLTFAIRDELARVQSASGQRPAVLFLKNHGVIAHSDDADECLRLHDDVNRRIARAFGVAQDDFPALSVAPAGEGLFEAVCPGLSSRIASGDFNEDFFLRQPLYPDQMVFLIGTFAFGKGVPEAGQALADPATGKILLRLPEAKARTIVETLAAVVFIADTLRKTGHALATMGSAAQAFIANWESEKYRKNLSK